MNNWMELDRALGEMAASGNAEVREDGRWLAELSPLRCEFRRSGENSLLHLWSDAASLTRRILRVKENTSQRIILEVHRFGQKKPGRLELVRRSSQRPRGRVTREQFRARFERILSEQFPDAEFEPLTAAPDLEHSLSGLYIRGRMREGANEWAILAVSPAENPAIVEGCLAFGILWFDYVRVRATRQKITGLRFFVPQGASRSLRERIAALSPYAPAEIFEFTEPDGCIRKVDAADRGNLESRLIVRHEAELTIAQACDSIVRIRALFAGSPASLGVRVVAEPNQVALSFRGLEFARWSPNEVRFGLGKSRAILSDATMPALEKLIRKLELLRNPCAKERNHPFFHSSPERWLETIILDDPVKLDAQLDPSYLYSQTPAFAAGDRGVLDLLGVTRRGRLVVIELKASEDLQMPFQALDYWLRVRRHQQEGDFQSYGYFTGRELSAEPPLIWLVAPGFHFHPATDTLLKYISADIRVTKIGLGENWRRGLKVIFRQ